MPHARATLALTGLVFVLACCETPLPLPEDACGASALQNLVGQPLGEADGLGGPGKVRLIRPGMMVTMDFMPERLNVRLDEAGLIVSVSCG